MAWEQRGSSFYYYKKLRQNNKVVSIYLGKGIFAQSLVGANNLLKIAVVREQLRLIELKQCLTELKVLRKSFRKFSAHQGKIDKLISFLKIAISL